MITFFRRVSVEYWRGIALSIAALVFIGWLLLYRLVALYPTLSSNESSSIAQSQNLKTILNNPINAPYKLLQFVVGHYTSHTILWDRLVSVVIGLLILVVFYLIVRVRYTNFVAVFGTALFGSSTWFLFTSRTATANVLLLSGILLLWIGQLLYRAKQQMAVTLCAVILCGLLLYVPGMIWFLLIGFLWQQKYITKLLDDLPAWFRVFIIFLAVALVAPIGWALVHTPSLAEGFLGTTPHALKPIQYLKNLVEVPVNLFFRGPKDSSIWLGRLPILDVFMTVMFALGLFCIWTQRKLQFNKLTVGAIILGVILITAGGSVTISILIPFIYLVSIAGIAELLRQWFTVFPKNPLARAAGIGLLTIAIFIAGYYQTIRYFVAWPNSTKSANNIQQNID